MRISSRIFTSTMAVATVASIVVFATSARAQHRGNVIPGNPGPSGPTATDGTVPMLTGGIDYTEGDPPPSKQQDILDNAPSSFPHDFPPPPPPPPPDDPASIPVDDTSPDDTSHNLGGPVGLRLYGSNGVAGVGGSSSSSGGFRLSDTAGLISNANALTPGFRSITSGGGFGAYVDASRALDLNANQRLWFGFGAGGYSDNMTFSASALTPGGTNANAGFAHRDVFTTTGSANYAVNNFYVSGRASFDSDHAEITNNLGVPGAQGSTNGRGYDLRLTAGELFPLFNSTGLKPATIVKAPPKTPGGYAVFLDLSGHYSYRRETQDGFTDSSGFTYGAQQLSYNDLGARARLLAVVPDRGFAWMPFVGATFDHRIGFSDTIDIPAQGLTPADRLILSPGNTFWGTELGLELLGRSNVIFGMKAFYEASSDMQTVGGRAYLRIPFENFASTTDSGIRVLSPKGMPVKAPPPPTLWNWTGLYFGGHVGGALSETSFADPFGPSIYGDTVRSPGFLGGGQIGYNWQKPGSRWVLGIEADASLMDSDGDVTCFAASATIVNSTCRVRPHSTGTFTGRVGYTFGPGGRSLIYAKGGLGWVHDEIDMALNANGNNPARRAALEAANNQGVTLWGGTVGFGFEHALTPAWSLKAEYDFVDLGHGNVANLGNASIMPLPPFTVGVVPPGSSGISQNLHEMKLGLNYKWGADPRASGWTASPTIYRDVMPATGWEVEAGGRYFGSWGEFQKDYGLFKSVDLPPLSDISRLTYSGMRSYSGEFFGRIETPWNAFVKGYVGGGGTNSGRLNDEDNVVVFGPVVAAYSNTLSPAATGRISYGAIDGGYDFLRGPGYKVGAFAGYFAFNQTMNAFGCLAIASVNCAPNPVPTSGSPVITENDKWTAARIGVSAETMLTDRIKISGEVAYLPWVNHTSLDQHFVGNTGALAEIMPASGSGRGVQIEAVISYFVTPHWSVGLGGRYWSMWTTPDGQRNCTFGCPAADLAPQFYRAQVEQIGGFFQTSYKFDWNGAVASLY
jgi:outer membrane protein with beta-barrel domain